MKCAILLKFAKKKDICKGKSSAEESAGSRRPLILGNAVRETGYEGKLRQLKGKKDDLCRAVRAINAMESLKVLPVKYEQFLVAKKYRYM